jgi:cytochrome P450
MSVAVASSSNAVVCQIDPFSEQFLTEPYPYHAEIRDAGSVVWLETYGIWGAGRHDEVKAALADHTTFCSGRGVGLVDVSKVTPWRPPSIILEQDPPIHTRIRTVLMRIMSPAALRKMRIEFEREAIKLVDQLVEKRQIDGVVDLAEAFPLNVFGNALGLAVEGRKNILAYSAMAFNAFGPHNSVFKASVENSDEVVSWTMANCARDALAPGSFGAQIYDGVDQGELSDKEAALLMRTFMTAGVDTTVNGLANALYCFSRFPDQWELLRQNPTLVRQAFDEVLRLESPVQTFFRTLTTDTVLGDVALREGDKILLFLASANRDPRQWSEPTRLDILRKATGHVAFGHGIHGCVGQMLARLEAEVMLTVLLERVAQFKPTGVPARRLNNTLRGLSSLPLEFVPS